MSRKNSHVRNFTALKGFPCPIRIIIEMNERRRLKIMKIRTIMATAATGIVLVFTGSSLAFGAEWSCPRGYEDCTGYEYCTTHDHGDCEGHWSEDGNWVCPDGTHSWCASSSAGSPAASASGNSEGRSSNGHHSESGNRGGHHNRQGCGSHHR